MTTSTTTPSRAITPLTLESGTHRLQLLPELGGSIAAWEYRVGGRWQPMLRPWNHAAPDAYTFACFPLAPWSNRIGAGGFEQDGVHYPVAPNRAGEPYPIHGDAWLQAWQIEQSSPTTLTLALTSDRFGGNPYSYRASQRFDLQADALVITLQVTHLGKTRLPYGLGLHPYFLRDADTRLQMQCDGLWLSRDDPMPVSHSTVLPPTFDYRTAASLDGPLIDHCFTGWDGKASISYPRHGFAIDLTMAACDGYALMYRPPGLDFFCLEPITHPIDAFHMPGQPGLRLLASGQSMTLSLSMRVQES